MKLHRIQPYSLRIKELFRFDDGTVVFAGPVEGGGRELAPCTSTLVVNGEARSIVYLAGERMPGNLPNGYRVVFTHDHVDLEYETVLESCCEIICSGDGEHITHKEDKKSLALR